MVLAAAVLLWLLVVPALAAAVPDSVTDALPPETASRLEGLDECADHTTWTKGLSRLWEEALQYLGAALREKASGAALLLGVVLLAAWRRASSRRRSSLLCRRSSRWRGRWPSPSLPPGTFNG